MSDGSAPALLVVEDEEHLAAGLALNFKLEGFDVTVARTGREAADLMLAGASFDAIVLDVMLPDLDGFELCRSLRDAGNFVPVIMLTARDAVDDRVRGLEAGADDYLTKPFQLSELLARVQSLVRRSAWERRRPESAGAEVRFGRVRVDFEGQEVRVDDEPVRLTKLELDLLRYFVENPRRVLSRSELQEQVWKLRNYPNTRMVDNFMMRLRRYFEVEPGQPQHFVSVRGAGYKFVPDPE